MNENDVYGPENGFQTSERDIFRYFLALENGSGATKPSKIADAMPYGLEDVRSDLENLEDLGYAEIEKQCQSSYVEVQDQGVMDEKIDESDLKLPDDDVIYLFDDVRRISLTDEGRHRAEQTLGLQPLKPLLRKAIVDQKTEPGEVS